MALSKPMSAVLLAAAAALAAGQPPPNLRPIIGILSLPNEYPNMPQRSYFPASYVKWLESAGARVVPLPYTMSDADMTAMLANLNGAFFTGGGADFQNADGSLTDFAHKGQLIFNTSVAAAARGEWFPLWGTCLGHEMIQFLGSNCNSSTVSGGFDAENITLPLSFTAAALSSRLYGSMPQSVLDIFATQPVTMNNHQAGITPADFAAAPALASRFRVLATNVDREGRPFVSSTEAVNMPIYTSQYHPEKVQFEWNPLEVINHSYDSIVANYAPALFFVNETRKNYRSFPTAAAEAAALIDNYNSVVTSSFSSFDECYFFD